VIDLTVSNDGTLWYRTDPKAAPQRDVVWAGRDGKISEIDPAWLDDITNPALSPDGTRVAVSIPEVLGRNIWVKELKPSGTLTKLTFEGSNSSPWWSDGGRSIRFVESHDGILEVPADGSGAPQVLLADARTLGAMGVIRRGTGSTDGRWLVLEGTLADIFRFQLGVDSVPVSVMASRSRDLGARLSPDGQWLLYQSLRSGRMEAYVAAFPNTSRSLAQVSSAGAVEARWSSDGREIFYRTPEDELVSVEVRAGTTLTLGARTSLFRLGRVSEWDVAPDGRFLLVRSRAASGGGQILVENFFEELEAKVSP